MKCKIFYLWALIVLTCLSVQAQTLSPSVISSGGGYTAENIGSLSFTISEMTMVETFVKGSIMLTQGFQQPEISTVSIEDVEITPCDIVLHPNPTSGKLLLSFFSGSSSLNSVKIYNLNGTPVFYDTFHSITGQNSITIDLSRQTRGMYFLEFVTLLHGRKIVSVHKISLIY